MKMLETNEVFYVNVLKEEYQKNSEIMEKRGYLVVKSNTLIQKSRFSLSTQAQKCILYIISKIVPEDMDFKEVDFKISEFCEVCGLDKNNGANYKYIKQTLKEIRDKSIWVELQDGSENTLSWINSVNISRQSGTVKLKIDDLMKPYLLQLSEKFTRYELLYTLAMKSQYSIRLYELLKSYEWKYGVEFEIEELKRLLDAENYKRFPDFKRYVLDIAMRELEAYSDLNIQYDIIKVGRKYGKIRFNIKLKKDMSERMKTWCNIEERINHKQLSLLDTAKVQV